MSWLAGLADETVAARGAMAGLGSRGIDRPPLSSGTFFRENGNLSQGVRCLKLLE